MTTFALVMAAFPDPDAPASISIGLDPKVAMLAGGMRVDLKVRRYRLNPDAQDERGVKEFSFGPSKLIV